MSKILGQVSKAAGAVATKPNSTAHQTFATSTRRQRSSSGQQPQGLTLPSKPPSDMTYKAFVRGLRAQNGVKWIDQAEAQKALRRYFIDFFGVNTFEVLRRQGQSAGSTDKNKAAWSRLQKEGEQYWKEDRS